MLEGSLAACIAVTFTNPFEVIKIKRQLAEELSSSRSHFTLPQIIRQDGVWSLQRGLPAAYAYQAVMNGFRFSLYPLLQDASGSNLLAGGLSGALSAFLSSPLNLIKTRQQSYSPCLQSLGVIKAQYPPQSSLTTLCEFISKRNPLRALWHGAPSAALRTGVGSAVQFASYDAFKMGAGQDASWKLKATGAMVSGVLTALAMNPFDVIMTRMYNNEASLYSSWWQCFSKMIKYEGPLALWRGLPAHYVRIGPHTALTLIIFDWLSIK